MATKNQMKKVFESFYKSPKTMKEVDSETNVMRESICRYVGTLRLENKISLVGTRKCTVTGYPNVGIYTTNPDLFVKSNQLELF